MGFPRQESGVGCHFLLQGIFLTQGLNPGICVSCTGRGIPYHRATGEAPLRSLPRVREVCFSPFSHFPALAVPGLWTFVKAHRLSCSGCSTSLPSLGCSLDSATREQRSRRPPAPKTPVDGNHQGSEAPGDSALLKPTDNAGLSLKHNQLSCCWARPAEAEGVSAGFFGCSIWRASSHGGG